MNALREVLARTQALLEAGTPFVVITLVGLRGSAPQELGAKAIVTAEGLLVGTVGGGKLETYAVDHARGLLAAPHPACTLETINLQTDIGMTCGGQVTLLFERTDPGAWEIAVFGAGHVSQALVPLLSTLDARITVLDTRSDWLARLPVAPNVHPVLSDSLPDAVATLRSGAAIVVMTQGHATDLPILDRALSWGQYSYLGVLGSTVKSARIRRELEGLGHDPDRVRAIHCPMGLPIGRNTPPEIAISIAAQLLERRIG